ncbi:MAG: hypothetical protein Q9160_006285 [Pyrenula sp. 1 TL-2023]
MSTSSEPYPSPFGSGLDNEFQSYRTSVGELRSEPTAHNSLDTLPKGLSKTFAPSSPQSAEELESINVSDESACDSDDSIEFMSRFPEIYENLLEALKSRFIALDLATTFGQNQNHTAGEQRPASQAASRDSASSVKSKPNSVSGPQVCANKRRKIDEKDGSDDEENHKDKPTPSDGSQDDERLFACPYSKFEPARYSEVNNIEKDYRGCSSKFLPNISRLK